MKKIAAILLALALAAGLCACGGGSGSKDVDMSAMAAELIGSGAFTDVLSEPAEGLAARLYGFEDGDVAECVLYTGTGATAEEIFLAKTSGSAAASRVQELCRTRVENQKSAFRSYVPEEVAKLESAVLQVSGDYVFLIVPNDAAVARSVVDSFLGG